MAKNDDTAGISNILPFDGIVVVGGAHDTGKTLFAFEAVQDPSKCWFVDDDIKGARMEAAIRATGQKLAGYSPLAKFKKDSNGQPLTDLEYHKVVVAQVIRKIPAGLDVIIWDTWADFAGTCHTFVTSNPGLFRKSWSPMGQIKGAQEWQAARDLEAGFIAELKEKCRTLILVLHLKDDYQNGKKVPGKQIMAGSSVISRVANMRLWLRRNPNGTAVPMGLVLKRIEKLAFVPGQGLQMVSVLPTKVVPLPEESSLWMALNRYWHDPVGNRPLREDEMLTPLEFSIVNNTLTQEQQILFELLLKAGSAAEEFEPNEGTAEPEFLDEEAVAAIRKRIDEAKAAGHTSPAAIAKAVGISVGEVHKYQEK